MCYNRNCTFVVLTSPVSFLLLILGLTAPVHPENFQASLWEEGNKRLAWLDSWLSVKSILWV